MNSSHIRKKNTAHKASLIWMFLDGSKLLFALGILFTGITALSDMIIPQIIRIAVDNVIGRKPADFPQPIMTLITRLGGFSYLRMHLWIMAISIIAVALLKVISQYAFRVFNTMASETLVKNTRDTLFSHLEHLPFSWHMKNRAGDIIQRCTSDIETMQKFVSDQMITILRIIILLIFSLFFMLRMNASLAVIALIPAPIILANAFFFGKKVEACFEEFDKNEGILSSIVQENLTGVRVVRAFGRERVEQERFCSQNSFYADLGTKMGKFLSKFWCTSDVLCALQVMIVIIFGAVFCIRGMMSEGEYIAFISYNALFTWPIHELGRTINDMSKTGVSIERIRYIMESEMEHDCKEAVAPELNKDIAFEHVSFSYDDCTPLLQNINFTVKAGTTVGILGGTGSGKTTLMLLLDKLYPLAEGGGKITIGGVDIANIKTDYLRKNIGMVLQDPYLFSRTVGENIGIANENMSESDIEQAARSACLDRTIAAFENGYQTIVGEGGVTLSGGQKQRAAIARILTKDTPIMIFDDSLSAVDTETDAKIRNSLEAKFGSATIFMISHRITTLSKADQIIVLDKGKIAELGTHNELLAHHGIYRQIFDIQSSGKETK